MLLQACSNDFDAKLYVFLGPPYPTTTTTTTPGAWGGLHTGSIAQKTNPRASPEEKKMWKKFEIPENFGRIWDGFGVLWGRFGSIFGTVSDRF